MSDKVREKLSSAIVVISSKSQDKVSFFVSVSGDLVKKGYHAGKIAKRFAAKIDGSGEGNLIRAGRRKKVRTNFFGNK
jgi:alanyl-tRNA synthetase